MVEIRTLLSIFFAPKREVCVGGWGGGRRRWWGHLAEREMEKEAPFSLHPRSCASPRSARERRKAAAAALWQLLGEEAPVGRGGWGVRGPRAGPSPPAWAPPLPSVLVWWPQAASLRQVTPGPQEVRPGMQMVNGPPREDWGVLRLGWGAQGSSREGVAAPMGGRAAGLWVSPCCGLHCDHGLAARDSPKYLTRTHAVRPPPGLDVPSGPGDIPKPHSPTGGEERGGGPTTSRRRAGTNISTASLIPGLPSPANPARPQSAQVGNPFTASLNALLPISLPPLSSVRGQPSAFQPRTSGVQRAGGRRPPPAPSPRPRRGRPQLGSPRPRPRSGERPAKEG